MDLVIDRDELKQVQEGRKLVVQYLQEARALEEALVTNLRAHIGVTPEGDYRAVLERHLDETAAQAEAVGRRLEELGEGQSLLKLGIGLAEAAVGQALVVAKAPLDLVRGHGGEEKLLKNAKDEIASEALEIATYDGLEAAARATGDERTAELAVAHREQEERALAELREQVALLARATVAARAAGRGSYDLGETGAAQAAKGLAGQAQSAVKGVEGKARGAAGQAQAAATSAVEDAKAKGQQVAGRAQAKADEVKGEAQAKAEEVKGEAQARAEEVAGKAEQVVDQASEQVEEAAEDAKQAAAGQVAETAGDVERTAARSRRAAEREARPAAQAPTGDQDLPIEGYAKLNAGDVILHLSALSQVELAQVADFEREHRNRKSVLDRIGVLTEPEPFSGYDALDEAAVIGGLEGRGAHELKAVHDYEQRHKRRVDVLAATQQALNA